ncbi:MAG: hypothetical protein ACRC0A_02785 [Chitinophagaceae bacterium]
MICKVWKRYIHGIAVSQDSSAYLGYEVSVDSRSTSRDSRVKAVADIFIEETRDNICDKFGSTYGRIEWSMNYNHVRESKRGITLLSGLTLCIPNLLGFPFWAQASSAA